MTNKNVMEMSDDEIFSEVTDLRARRAQARERKTSSKLSNEDKVTVKRQRKSRSQEDSGDFLASLGLLDDEDETDNE